VYLPDHLNRVPCSAAHRLSSVQNGQPPTRATLRPALGSNLEPHAARHGAVAHAAHYGSRLSAEHCSTRLRLASRPELGTFHLIDIVFSRDSSRTHLQLDCHPPRIAATATDENSTSVAARSSKNVVVFAAVTELQGATMSWPCQRHPSHGCLASLQQAGRPEQW